MATGRRRLSRTQRRERLARGRRIVAPPSADVWVNGSPNSDTTPGSYEHHEARLRLIADWVFTRPRWERVFLATLFGEQALARWSASPNPLPEAVDAYTVAHKLIALATAWVLGETQPQAAEIRNLANDLVERGQTRWDNDAPNGIRPPLEVTFFGGACAEVGMLISYLSGDSILSRDSIAGRIVAGARVRREFGSALLVVICADGAGGPLSFDNASPEEQERVSGNWRDQQDVASRLAALPDHVETLLRVGHAADPTAGPLALLAWAEHAGDAGRVACDRLAEVGWTADALAEVAQLLGEPIRVDASAPLPGS
jgi:hypothetical protein